MASFRCFRWFQVVSGWFQLVLGDLKWFQVVSNDFRLFFVLYGIYKYMINSYTYYNYNSYPSMILWPDFLYFCFPEIQQSSASTETHIGICQNLWITFLNIVDRVSLHLKLFSRKLHSEIFIYQNRIWTQYSIDFSDIKQQELRVCHPTKQNFIKFPFFTNYFPKIQFQNNEFRRYLSVYLLQ